MCLYQRRSAATEEPEQISHKACDVGGRALGRGFRGESGDATGGFAFKVLRF